MENMNEPTGVIKTIPRGPELMHKLIKEGAERKLTREQKEERAAASAQAVPKLVVHAATADAAGVRELISQGDDLEALAPDAEGGWRPIHAACQGVRRDAAGALDCLSQLIAAGARVDSTISTVGSTALHVACEVRSAEAVRMLLTAGAVADAETPDGTTPLIVACHVGSAECVSVLLTKGGANVNRPRQAGGGSTPLFIACNSSQPECVKALLAANANVHATLKRSKRTALHISCAENRAKCVEALLMANASVDAPDSTGMTPLDLACENDATDCIRRLLKAGAEVEPHLERLKEQGKLAPLYTCARRGHDEGVTACLEAGARVDRINGQYHTAIYAAVCAASPSTVRLLLRHGANPTLPDAKEEEEGNGGEAVTPPCPPLIAACHSKIHAEAGDKAGPAKAGKLIECARALLDGKADVTVCHGRGGKTALHVAAEAGAYELVRLLVDANAPLDAREEDERLTPLGLAQKRLKALSGSERYGQYQRIIAYLEVRGAPLLKKRVKVEGLVGRPELNGLVGEAVLYDEKSGRYGVRLEGCESVKLKPGNLVVVVDAEAPTGSADEEDGEPVLELN